MTSHREVEVSQLLRWRDAYNKSAAARPLTLTPFIAACVVSALQVVPALNALFDAETEDLISYGQAVHLGIATATPDGLVVPVIRDADLLDVQGLGHAITELAESARNRGLRPEQFLGGSFTITNYGTRGGWLSTPYLMAPQVGIAGFGRVAERPWIIDGQICVGRLLPVSVTMDHRIIDGDVNGKFLGALCGYLSSPSTLPGRFSGA